MLCLTVEGFREGRWDDGRGIVGRPHKAWLGAA